MDLAYLTYSPYAFYHAMSTVEGEMAYVQIDHLVFCNYFPEVLCYAELLLLIVMQMLVFLTLILLFIEVCEQDGEVKDFE